jgi:diguanylate cyclase (GGDEF)-like protein
VLIDVDYKSPMPNEPVRLLLRNFNSNYSNIKIPSSFKYNSIQFVPAPSLLKKPIPIGSFQVASWWIEEYKIGYEDAQVDIRNVSLIEVETAVAKQSGDYSIYIKKLVLQGHMFSEATLLKALLFLWLVATLYMIWRQHHTLKVISNRDALTGITNRRGLNELLEKYFSTAGQKQSLCMFYIDIDDFKKINDSYGHLIGDRLLCEFCTAIEQELAQFSFKAISQQYLLARLSGDEFALIIYDINDFQVIEIANRLISRFARVINVEGVEIRVNASIGIARSSGDASAPEVLMSHADSAMYHSKKSGKNQFKIFDQDVSEDIIFRQKISAALRRAIEQQQFTLLYMPIYHSEGLRIRGAEVLLRCTSPDLAGIGPDIFIPIAEEFGLIRDIDAWVIETACKTLGQNPDLIAAHKLNFCINISALELVNQQFPKQVKTLLNRYKIDPKIIELELTETSLVNVDEQSIALLSELKALGVALSLDDFGTGYTAFNQLLNYPVNCLKIDRSFINRLDVVGDSGATMVDVILAIARSYDLNVIAEGVETDQQYQYLRDKDCGYVQGYFMSKPITWAEFSALLPD